MDKKPIHMVKAAFHNQFRRAMENCSLCAGDYFNYVGLPAEIRDPESLLPEKPFWRLINSVALQENIPDFGMRVAQVMPWHRVDSLAPLLKDCDSLENLLETFCMLASSQSSNVAFSLQRKRSRYWFNYHGELVIKRDVQMELYRITSMIDLVRQAAGADWFPERVRLFMPKNRVVQRCSILRHSKILFSKTCSGLMILPELMALPVDLTGTDAPVPNGQTFPVIPSDFEISIRKIIDSYSPGGKISINGLARLTDMTLRTLQRRLADHNLNFMQMVNRARYAHASEKLKDTRLPIAEIARSMGYSDPAHFTRAFRRWAGVTPSHYRKHQSS